MIKSPVAILLALLIGNEAGDSGDELCKRLDRLEHQVALSRTAKSVSVKVMWIPNDWTVACASYEAAPGAREFCSWLPKHISWEFPHGLPSRVLTCYSVTENPFAAGHFEAASVVIQTKGKNHVKIETGEDGQRESADWMPWMRLTVDKGAK